PTETTSSSTIPPSRWRGTAPSPRGRRWSSTSSRARRGSRRRTSVLPEPLAVLRTSPPCGGDVGVYCPPRTHKKGRPSPGEPRLRRVAREGVGRPCGVRFASGPPFGRYKERNEVMLDR